MKLLANRHHANETGRHGERRGNFLGADQFGIPIRYIGVGERIEDCVRLRRTTL